MWVGGCLAGGSRLGEKGALCWGERGLVGYGKSAAIWKKAFTARKIVETVRYGGDVADQTYCGIYVGDFRFYGHSLAQSFDLPVDHQFSLQRFLIYTAAVVSSSSIPGGLHGLEIQNLNHQQARLSRLARSFASRIDRPLGTYVWQGLL